MDAATLSKAMGGNLPLSRYQALLPEMNRAMRAAGVTTPLRAAHWLSQLGHECLGLSALTEFASGEAYNGRLDLGNTQPGDGPRFRGRGAIMVTGRGHYTNLSKWAHGKGLVPTATYFVDNPEMLASDRYYCIGAEWYWTVARPQMNALCDKDDFVGVTKAINGGTNGLADRRQRLARAKQLGDAILPTKGGNTMALFDIDMSQQFGFGGPRATSGIQRVVIHTTENATGTPAANVANYQIRSKTGSYHYLVDASGKRIRCNTDDWITWSTGNNAGNVQGLNLSFTTYSANTRAQWLAQEKMLRAGATVVADWCKKYNIPVVKVTTGRGICGHGDMRAFGGTDHTDPGPNFPWDVFIKYVKAAMGGTTTGGDTASKGDGMALAKDEREALFDIRAMLMTLCAQDMGDGKKVGPYGGWAQTGNRTRTDLLAAIGEKVGVSNTFDTKGGK